jgi:uncharacterized protein (DUF433 family)
MRVSVELILSLLAQGGSQEAILDDYPGLEPEDIRACLAYAHAVIVEARAGTQFMSQQHSLYRTYYIDP